MKGEKSGRKEWKIVGKGEQMKTRKRIIANENGKKRKEMEERGKKYFSQKVNIMSELSCHCNVQFKHGSKRTVFESYLYKNI